jgi:tetratricopeptide (TPR) repeat protein
MSRPKYRIFLSSPGDVASEREEATTVVERFANRWSAHVAVELYVWEHEPMLATRGDFQANIESTSEFDLVIFIFRGRLGSRLHSAHHLRPDGTVYESGTAYEFETGLEAFRSHGRPEFLVFWRRGVPLIPVEPAALHAEMVTQWEALKDFRQKWFYDETEKSFRRPYTEYDSAADFGEKIEMALHKLLAEFCAKRKALPGAQKSAPIFLSITGEGMPIPWNLDSPYRGLQVFDVEHERIFFGRTRERDEVLDALKTRLATQNSPFILIVGSSGSGKSSFLRAGLLPWLSRPGIIAEIDSWRTVVFEQSDLSHDPLLGLGTMLLSEAALPELASSGMNAQAIRGLLVEHPEGFIPLLKQSLAVASREERLYLKLERDPSVRVMLGIDQLEEIFTSAESDPEQCARFFRAVRMLVESGCVWVIASVRSDFLPQCDSIADLMDLKQGLGQYHLTSPGPAQISQIIRNPAEIAGVSFEDLSDKGKLDERICNDALSEPGTLPLLEYVLDELYRTCAEERILSHAKYEALGGVEGALRKRAEETFASLGESERASLDSVLRRLVRLSSPGGEVLTRNLADFESITAQREAARLIAAFAEARLVVMDQNRQGRRVVMFAHESLLRVWPEIQRWETENRDFLRIRSRLAGAYARWEDSKRHDDYLLAQGRPITEAEELLTRHSESLEPGEIDFIKQSRRAIVRSSRRRRAVMAAVLTLLVVVTIFEFWQIRELKRQQELILANAERETKSSEATQSITQALLYGDSYLASKNFEDAEAAYEEALNNAVNQSNQYPQTVAWLFYQAVTNERLSQVCLAKDSNITQASEHIEVALGILDKLVKTEDPNDRTESLLAVVLKEQGVLKKAQGDEVGAKESFDRAQKLYAELSARDRSNARRWLRGSQAGPGGSSAGGSEASVSEKSKNL